MTHQPKLVDAMPEQTLVDRLRLPARHIRGTLRDGFDVSLDKDQAEDVATCLEQAADRIERLEAAITYAAETTNDKHTARKLFAALSASNEGGEVTPEIDRALRKAHRDSSEYLGPIQSPSGDD